MKKGRFTENGGGASTSENNEDKMQKRAEILFSNTQVSQAQKYIDNRKETDPIKKYENIGLGNFEQSLKNKSEETAQRWTPECNAKFSDSEVIKAREFIHGREGFDENAYPDIAGIWTIGYGHTGKVDGKPIKEGMRITKEKAEELYKKDFEIHTAPLKEVKVPLNSNQKIALASFIYNFGPTAFTTSTLLKKLNNGDYQGATNELDIWIKAKNPKTGMREIKKGLITRRQLEKNLFLTPYTE